MNKKYYTKSHRHKPIKGKGSYSRQKKTPEGEIQPGFLLSTGFVYSLAEA